MPNIIVVDYTLHEVMEKEKKKSFPIIGVFFLFCFLLVFFFPCAQWNVADYFNQNKDKLHCNNGDDINKLRVTRNASGDVMTDDNSVEQEIPTYEQQELIYPDFPGVTMLAEMSEFDKLWMCLFTKLGKYSACISYVYEVCSKSSGTLNIQTAC